MKNINDIRCFAKIFLAEFMIFLKQLLRIRIRSKYLMDSAESESSPNPLDFFYFIETLSKSIKEGLLDKRD